MNPAEALFDADVASRSLGIEVAATGPGRATVRMRVTEAMLNGRGMAHGGFVFLLADTAFALACNSDGAVTLGAGADIDFVRPAHLGDVLVADAVERSRFGRSGLYDITVRRSIDGAADPSPDAVIAEMRGRSRTVQAGPQSDGPPPPR